MYVWRERRRIVDVPFQDDLTSVLPLNRVLGFLGLGQRMLYSYILFRISGGKSKNERVRGRKSLRFDRLPGRNDLSDEAVRD
jgi:hypothetical protein